MKTPLLIMGVVLSCNAFSQSEYVCTHAQETRTIEVVYTTPGLQIPCEVQYTKSTGTETLWSAQYEVGYCEMKAEAFREKQESYGWTCDNTLKTQESASNVKATAVQTTEAATQEVETEVQKATTEVKESAADVKATAVQATEATTQKVETEVQKATAEVK